jgi:mRNA interferase RelE/StbE
MNTVAFTLAGRRAFKKLSADLQARIMDKLTRYAETDAGDVKAMQGQGDARLRVGDFRILFIETETTINVTDVGHRRDIYR